MNANYNYHGPVVVFDLDDTLFRERDFCRSGFRYILSENPDAEELFEMMERELSNRRNPFDPYEVYLERKKAEGFKSDIKDEIERYRTHTPKHLPLIEGAKDVLNTLQKYGVRMGLITDGRSVTQRRKIEALGLKRYVPDENIIISEESGYDKNSPDNFIAMVRRYPEASGFYYIGDNERKDFLQPNLLGWTTLKVPYHSDNVHEDYVNLDELGRPSVCLDKITDIIKLIESPHAL